MLDISERSLLPTAKLTGTSLGSTGYTVNLSQDCFVARGLPALHAEIEPWLSPERRVALE